MATTLPSFDAPRGRMPTLQFVPPGELQVDPSYQRGVAIGESQALIRRIAKAWNWALCQPLVVSRRMLDDREELFVIDGQHRLEAAKLRGDIAQLPCVIAAYRTAADEAADFVQINRQRRPLTKLEVFRAAVASGDADAVAILEAITAAGLTLAPHTNYASWKPGMVGTIAGVQSAWKRHGELATSQALLVLARAWPGQIQQYAGTVFPGIAAICAEELKHADAEQRIAKLVATWSARTQAQWRLSIQRVQLESGVAYDLASAKVLRDAWEQANGTAPIAKPSPVAAPTRPAAIFVPDGREDGKAWCDQCDTRVSAGRVKACSSQWCKLRDVA